MGRAGRHRRGGRVAPPGIRPLGESRRSGRFPDPGRPAWPGDPAWPGAAVWEERDHLDHPAAAGRPGGDHPDADHLDTDKPDRVDPGPSGLLDDVRSCLESGDPVDLLTGVSGLVAVAEPSGPMERASRPDGGVSLGELIEVFADIDRPETTAILAVVAGIGPTRALRHRAAAIANRRSHPLPEWLARLDQAVADRAVEVVDVLGDGDDLVIGVRLAGGSPLTVVLYVDHNLGTVVKDGFVLPRPISEVLRLIKAHRATSDGTRWLDVDPAAARAHAEEALHRATRLSPPIHTEAWPAARPLVEWAVRLLPDGGRGYRRPVWSPPERTELTEDFFGSPPAVDLHGDSYRDLFEALLWFGCDYGSGDPLQWSPIRVEMLLTDWIPRTLVAGPRILSKAPDLLRALVRYAGDRKGLRPALTAPTLAAVDYWEPEYQRRIRTPRPGDPATVGSVPGPFPPAGPGADAGLDPEEINQIEEIVLDTLRREVGGAAALDRLDATPLPDEAFDWTDIPADIRPVVGEILDRCDGYATVLTAGGMEYRTAFRRLLARVARGDPRVFRRRARSDTAAAAVCWIIGKANEMFAPCSDGILVKDLAAHFGLSGSGFSQRARTLLTAAGAAPDDRYDGWGYSTGSADLLIGRQRRKIMDIRDDWSSALP